MNISNTFHFIPKNHVDCGKVSRIAQSVCLCVCYSIYVNINNSESIIALMKLSSVCVWLVLSTQQLWTHNNILSQQQCTLALCITITVFVAAFSDDCVLVCCTSLTMQINSVITKLPKIYIQHIRIFILIFKPNWFKIVEWMHFSHWNDLICQSVHWNAWQSKIVSNQWLFISLLFTIENPFSLCIITNKRNDHGTQFYALDKDDAFKLRTFSH